MKRQDKGILVQGPLHPESAENPKGGGRPRVSVGVRGLQKAYDLAASGLSRRYIATALGMSRDTFDRRLKDDRDFEDAINKGSVVIIQKLIEHISINAFTPMPDKGMPGGNLQAQLALYDRIAGPMTQRHEVAAVVMPLFAGQLPPNLLEVPNGEDEKE